MKRYRDCDDDIWTEQNNGLYELTFTVDAEAIGDLGMRLTLGDLKQTFGPLTELCTLTTVDTEPAPEQYITRAELRVALDRVANNYGCAGTRDGVLISDAFRALAGLLDTEEAK